MRSALLFVFLLLSFFTEAQVQTKLERGIPEREGLSSSAILNFINETEEKIDAIHSLMIVKNGKVISEGWWKPYNKNSPHELWSLSKSFTSTAVGFAVNEGLLSIDDLVISFFPEKVPEKPSWQLEQLRIVDLLTMNTGHVKEPKLNTGEGDWEFNFLNSDIQFMPGTHFLYNTPATFMLSSIIQKVSGEILVDYLYPRLFEPLGIEKPDWEMNDAGVNVGGWGLHLKTEDIAKFGLLYLNKGMWNGKQIIPKKWIESATSKQVSNGSNPSNDWTQGYGYQFWRSRHNSYRGDGAMGQFCLVIPEKNLVIAITSGTNNMGMVMQLVWDNILPEAVNISLPNNTKMHNLLKEKTASLFLNPHDFKSSKAVKNLVNRKFKIENNDQGVKSVSFKKKKNKNYVVFDMEDGIETIEFGHGEFINDEIINHLPFTNLRRNQFIPESSLRYLKHKKIASSGAWINNNEFMLSTYLFETPVRMDYKFIFEGKILKIESVANNYLGKSNQPNFLRSVEND